MTHDRDLRQATLEAESRPGTIGHALARYRETRDWSRDELAEWLGLTPAELDTLAAEPLPPPTLPATSGGGPAVPWPTGSIYLLADRYGAHPGRLREAIG